MADAPLATPADAVLYGKGTITEASLRTASVRARGYTGQTISAASSTVEATGPRVQLPQRPVRSITSVTGPTGAPVRHRLRGSVLHLDTHGDVTVTYEHGYTELPDHLIETLCTIAARIENIQPGLAGGALSEGGGAESMSYGWDAHQGVGGLVASERQALDRAFPEPAVLIVMSAG